jgi:HlyD family secretion protein
MKLSQKLAQQKLEQDYLIEESLSIVDSKIPVRELEKIVSYLWRSLAQAKQFVREQEEELADQIKIIVKLEAELQFASESDCQSLQQKIVEEKERAELLETTLAGQRSNLHQQELAYQQYRDLLQKRKESLLENRDNKRSVALDDQCSSPKRQQNPNLLSAMQVTKANMVKKIELKNKDTSFLKPVMRWTVALAIVGLLTIGASIVYGLRSTQHSSTSSTISSEKIPEIKSVTALGQLQPQGKTIQLAPPPNLGGAKVVELLVKEGDLVQANQVVAILENRDLLQAAVEQAQQDVKVAQANLAIIKAGAKLGEIKAQNATIKRLEAQLQGESLSYQAKILSLQEKLQGENATQQATIDRLQAELDNAQNEYQRYQQLAKNGAISTSDLERRYLTLETAQEKLKEAQANFHQTIATLEQDIRAVNANAQQAQDTVSQQIQAEKAELDRITEVRDVDVYKAQAEVERAIASLQKARQELELTYVKAPITSRVLKIYTYPGESVSSQQSILELGNTEQMMVIAEVYESDIGQVKPGQTVEIKSENGAFPGELTGKVSDVGWLIDQQGIFEMDPSSNADNRVVKVKIKLAEQDLDKLSRLSYSQVIVKIFLN